MDGTAGWRAYTHARARTYDTYTHAYTGSSFGLYLSPEVQESAAYIYIYIGVYNIYICTYTYIKRSTSSLSLYIYIFYLYLSFTVPPSNVSFRVPFPRLAFMAGIHGSGEIRVPSTLKLVIETYARASAQRRASSLPPSPPAKPRENPRLIAISPLCGLPRRLILGGEGRRRRSSRRLPV